MDLAKLLYALGFPYGAVSLLAEGTAGARAFYGNTSVSGIAPKQEHNDEPVACYGHSYTHRLLVVFLLHVVKKRREGDGFL